MALFVLGSTNMSLRQGSNAYHETVQVVMTIDLRQQASEDPGRKVQS